MPHTSSGRWRPLPTQSRVEDAVGRPVVHDGLDPELRRLLDESPDPASRLDRDLRYTYVNAAAQAIFGVPAGELIGTPDADLPQFGDNGDWWREGLEQVLRTGLAAQVDHSLEVGDRQVELTTRLLPQTGPDGEVVGILVVGRDHGARAHLESPPTRYAELDDLTGLLNRRGFLHEAVLPQAIRSEDHERNAVLVLDLDRFTSLNATYGHDLADQLLVEVARRLVGQQRRHDVLARVGADQFAILCRDADDTAASALGRRLREALEAPFVLDEQTLHISSSIGIAAGNEPPAALLSHAETAMSDARHSGPGAIHKYAPERESQRAAKVALEERLRQALTNGELMMFYQPSLTLADQSLVGVEALIRWRQPDGGFTPPADFIPVAEESNLIVAIGRWVLDETCRQLAAWNAQGTSGGLTMAVNISARQLAHRDLIDDVRGALARHGISPEQLCLEITETAALADTMTTERVYRALSELGVRLALDDFGTGYSSLTHLRRFPAHTLKIDKSFVDGLGRDVSDTAIIAAVTAMARAMGLSTVAEGIETDEQMDELIRLGCDEGQGFLLARPMPPEEIESAWMI